jgi:uncharacterized cupredoxin-like copper-binding protein
MKIMKKPHHLLIGLTALALLGGAVACGSDDDDQAAASAPASPAVTSAAYTPAAHGGTHAQAAATSPSAVTVTARDFSLEAPDTFPAGRVAVTFRNEGQEMHHAQFVRLNDGATMDQFAAALQQGPAAAAALGTDAGGPGAVSPGKSTTITQDLTAGMYVMLCFIPGADGVPHVAKGMLHPFQVSGSAPAAAEQPSDGEVILGDFTVLMPEMKSGTNTLTVTNAGRHAHEVVFARLTNGATFADAEPFLQGQGPEPSLEAVGGTVGMAPGQRAWVTVDLPPGDYLALCFIPDTASGAPHAFLGMWATFTVH